MGRHACHLVFSITLATSSARQADGQWGWQLPSFADEQPQRGLSLVAVFGYNAPVKRPQLLEPVIALFARQDAQLGECAGAGHGRGRPVIGRQIDLIGAPSTASRPAGTSAHIKAALRAAPRWRRQNVIGTVGPDVVHENMYVCCSERARLDSGSSVSLLGTGALANSLSP